MKNRFSDYIVDFNQQDKAKSVEKIFDDFSKVVIEKKNGGVDNFSFEDMMRLTMKKIKKESNVDINVPENITFDGVFNCLVKYPVEMTNRCPENVGGAYFPPGRKVYINQNAREIDKLHSLIHELCHYLFKHDIGEYVPRCELEAEFTTYVVEKMMGIENHHSKFYIFFVAQDIDNIEQTINICKDDILRTSKQLLQNLDCYL